MGWSSTRCFFLRPSLSLWLSAFSCQLWWVAPPHESSTLHGRPSFPYKESSGGGVFLSVGLDSKRALRHPIRMNVGCFLVFAMEDVCFFFPPKVQGFLKYITPENGLWRYRRRCRFLKDDRNPLRYSKNHAFATWWNHQKEPPGKQPLLWISTKTKHPKTSNPVDPPQKWYFWTFSMHRPFLELCLGAGLFEWGILNMLGVPMTLRLQSQWNKNHDKWGWAFWCPLWP